MFTLNNVKDLNVRVKFIYNVVVARKGIKTDGGLSWVHGLGWVGLGVVILLSMHIIVGRGTQGGSREWAGCVPVGGLPIRSPRLADFNKTDICPSISYTCRLGVIRFSFGLLLSDTLLSFYVIFLKKNCFHSNSFF